MTNTNNSNSSSWRRKKEEKDPDAMDVDAMSTEKRNYLMKKGACFICETPGHRASEHDEYEKKKEKEKDKGKSKASPKKDLRSLHALFQGLSMEDKKKLLAMTMEKGDEGKEEEEEKTDDEDF
jgi:lipoate-protein ligase A